MAGRGVVRYGAVEGGGTKFVCAVGTVGTVGSDDEARVALERRTRIDTTTPAETMERVAAFLERAHAGEPLAAVGVACFGPLELDPQRAAFGSLLRTPKPGWSGAPVVTPLAERLGVPVRLDTDVNGAALAEWRWGAARGCDPVLYLTVGTGIGGGAVVAGRPVHGLLHPEMGHIPVPRLCWPDGTPDEFPGTCPFHGGCLEGLASGPALQARLGASAQTAPADHPIWELEAAYLAHALATYVLVLSPQRIVLGGGVFEQGHLLDRVRRRLPQVLAGYVGRQEVGTAVERYVVAPAFRDAGLVGALALAQGDRGA